MINIIHIRPLYIYTESIDIETTDIDTNHSLNNNCNASAIFTIDGIEYNVPQNGRVIILDHAIPEYRFKKITVKLYMYDRQPHISEGNYYFSVNVPISIDVIDDDSILTSKGTVDLFFLQMIPYTIFHLVNTRYLINILKKNYSNDEINKSVHWLQYLIINKDIYLKLLDSHNL